MSDSNKVGIRAGTAKAGARCCRLTVGAIIRFEGRGIGGVAAHWRAQPGIVRAFQIPRPFAQLRGRAVRRGRATARGGKPVC